MRVIYVFLFGSLVVGINIVRSVEGGGTVLEELWDESGPKRCAIVDLVPTGSYEATLKRIGLSCIGFEGFPFGLFVWNYANVCKCVQMYENVCKCTQMYRNV